jgi:O-antigen ligase
VTARPHVPLVVTQLHHLFSVRDPLEDRVTGLAYEPSWLGNQLVLLYIPLLAASVAQRSSVFGRRRSRWSAELVLLVVSLVTLALTRSRISQLSLLVVAIVLGAGLGWSWIRRGSGGGPIGEGPARRGLLLASRAVALLAAVLAVAAASLWAISRSDERMRSLFTVRDRLAEANFAYPNEGIYEIANRLVLAERLVYWTTALRTFAQFPVLGVGPGNAGFFFADNLPAYGHQLTEIRQVVEDPSFGFPNPKNLWLRVLAEQGIAGFAAIGVWMGLTALLALSLWRQGSGWARVVGMAGAMAVLAQVIEGFSLDTYGLPHLWIITGLVAAAEGELTPPRAGRGSP